jgi:hypothetical protein
MSKIFDDLKEAERLMAEHKHTATAWASVAERIHGQTVIQSCTPDPVAQNLNANEHLPQRGSVSHDTRVGSVIKVLTGMPVAVAKLVRWPWLRLKMRSEHPQPDAISAFGDLGTKLESTVGSSFWKWFCLEQTREESGVHRFQPSRTQFQSLCYLDVAVSAKKDMQALTLGVQRAFIDGADEPFARDLVRSFLCTVFLQQKSEAVSQLVNELGTEFGGARPVIAAEGARREAPITRPSPPYLVFTGLGKRCAMESGACKLEMENVTDGSTRWFRLRVRLS